MTGGEKATILKRDVLGRITMTREQRETLLDEFERSGLKGLPFARMAGVNYPTFASWIQKRRRARGDYGGDGVNKPLVESRKIEARGAVRLLEAVIAPSVEGQRSVATEVDHLRLLEVQLPGGIKLRVADACQAALAAALIKALSPSC